MDSISDGSAEGRFEEHLRAFTETFASSAEVRGLRAADHALYEDLSLRSLVKEKQRLEAAISLAYQVSEPADGLLRSYRETMDKIASLPSVRAYDLRFEQVRKIKTIFEKKILARLA